MWLGKGWVRGATGLQNVPRAGPPVARVAAVGWCARGPVLASRPWRSVSEPHRRSGSRTRSSTPRRDGERVGVLRPLAVSDRARAAEPARPWQFVFAWTPANEPSATPPNSGGVPARHSTGHQLRRCGRCCADPLQPKALIRQIPERRGLFTLRWPAGGGGRTHPFPSPSQSGSSAQAGPKAPTRRQPTAARHDPGHRCHACDSARVRLSDPARPGRASPRTRSNPRARPPSSSPDRRSRPAWRRTPRRASRPIRRGPASSRPARADR